MSKNKIKIYITRVITQKKIKTLVFSLKTRVISLKTRVIRPQTFDT